MYFRPLANWKECVFSLHLGKEINTSNMISPKFLWLGLHSVCEVRDFKRLLLSETWSNTRIDGDRLLLNEPRAQRKGARGDHRIIEMEKVKLASKCGNALTRGVTRKYQKYKEAVYETSWLGRARIGDRSCHMLGSGFPLPLVQWTCRTKGVSLLTQRQEARVRKRTRK